MPHCLYTPWIVANLVTWRTRFSPLQFCVASQTIVLTFRICFELSFSPVVVIRDVHWRSTSLRDWEAGHKRETVTWSSEDVRANVLSTKWRVAQAESWFHLFLDWSNAFHFNQATKKNITLICYSSSSWKWKIWKVTWKVTWSDSVFPIISMAAYSTWTKEVEHVNKNSLNWKSFLHYFSFFIDLRFSINHRDLYVKRVRECCVRHFYDLLCTGPKWE